MKAFGHTNQQNTVSEEPQIGSWCHQYLEYFCVCKCMRADWFSGDFMEKKTPHLLPLPLGSNMKEALVSFVSEVANRWSIPSSIASGMNTSFNGLFK